MGGIFPNIQPAVVDTTRSAIGRKMWLTVLVQSDHLKIFKNEMKNPMSAPGQSRSSR
jgi:hypothetical protein